MSSQRGAAVAWSRSVGFIPYVEALTLMEQRAGAIAAGEAQELVWLLEHPALYTAGTSAKVEDLRDPDCLPVHRTGRGGQFTYHGPGQRIAYLMLDVRSRFRGDVRAFVRGLEGWVIDALAELGVVGRVVPGRVGVWVDDAEGEAKIAALGIRITRGVSLHGLSLNVTTDLAGYDGIVPCGITDRGVTSLAKLGVRAAINDVDNVLRATFERRFGPVLSAPDPLIGPTPTSATAPATANLASGK